MNSILKIESIDQLCKALKYEKSQHPLITLIDWKKVNSEVIIKGGQIVTNFYSIHYKTGCTGKMRYGRQHYDFHEGSMMFLAPGQTIVIDENEEFDIQGWGLFFHPDLIRRSTLAKKMREYTFFTYNTNEALHLSDKELQSITGIVDTIDEEIRHNIDVYTKELIITNVELLLNYCKRFYGRQFITRTNVNMDVVARFEEFLESYFDSDKPVNEGMPSVQYCAEQMVYSPNYLSDLLKKETGKNTQEHIHFYLIEKAKNLLVGTNEPVSQIAYCLGFDYPQHFSKLFKKKTGMSPAEYRK